ncbi:MAG TPA: glycoside hydrolase family 15 protein [Bryobacteraceae bacterium]|nr:glycoside hydrolase family 15 protein [Bryobacteraceae bacterium]
MALRVRRPRSRMSYQPIECHGVIGDMHTVALVASDGTIDWCCLPRFDSPSIFGALLDDRKGGFCKLAPTIETRTRQIYLPDSNVLLTRFLSPEGVGEVIDFMPVSRVSGGPAERYARQIIRIARAVRGELPFRFECRPAFNYARTPHKTMAHGHAILFTADHDKLLVGGGGDFRMEDNGAVSEFRLGGNASAAFVLRYENGDTDPAADRRRTPDELLQETLRFWRNWLSRSRYQGRWREMVSRSALALKLLTYQPTGAIIAAPTTSLPEEIGGVRNWDYRYTWIRDAAFSVYALMRLGFDEEVEAFAGFVQARAKQEELSEDGPLNVLYPIAEPGDTSEITLDHLDGYKGSKPVRVGNGAAGHFQLDIYGELVDSLYLANKYASPISWNMWEQIERMLNWLSKNWERPDRSMWEVRGDMRPFTYSRLQSWVALDRGIRIARQRSFPSDLRLWFTERDRIYRTVMKECWNESKRAFTQFPGSDAVDASVLLMPLMKFIAPADPRMLSTLDAVFQDLVSDTLVQRYQIGRAAEDGLPGNEGTFSVCSFWLVEAMARAGRVEQAQLVFEKMLTYANPLGLFSEEIGPAGESLGNFPQAFTHLGLISAAVNLNDLLDAAGASRGGGWFYGRGGRDGGDRTG